MSRSRRAGVLVAVLLATACGRPPAVPAGPVDLPEKPVDYVEVFGWSQGVPPGARVLEGPSATFKGPHFAYQFGALATRATIDETSGGLEGGPARAAAGHEFLVLYRLQGDTAFAPPPEGGAVPPMDVLVGTTRKRLPRQLLPGNGLVVSVPVGSDATLEVTDDKPYTYSVRNGNAAPPPAPSSSAVPKSGSPVRWDGGTYSAEGAYQGVRTSGPLKITGDLGTKVELGADLAGTASPPAKQIWLRFPDAKISTDDADLKLDLARSFSLTLPGGTKVPARPTPTGLLFPVPEPFTAGTLTIAPEFPATSTAKWSTRPTPVQIALTTG